MASRVFKAYVEWVRKNADNAPAMERFTHMLTIILMSPDNIVKQEMGNTIVNIQSFSNRAIISSAGRRLNFAEQMGIAGQIIKKMECLLELLLRRYCGHRKAWNFLLVLQFIKCCLNLVAHQQMFLAPSIWQAIRRQLRRLIVLPQRLLGSEGAGNGDPSATSSDLSRTRCSGGGPTPLVIPRVVAVRMFERKSLDSVNDGKMSSTQANGSGESSSGPLHCTAYDVLGVVVDLMLLLRPLLLLYCAKSAFPHTSMDTCTHMALAAESVADDEGTQPKSSAARTVDYGNFFAVKTLLVNGMKNSLLGNWSVWTLFLGLDILFVALARYILHYRKPIVCINKDARSCCGVGRGSYDRGAQDGEAACPEYQHSLEATAPVTAVSRDSLRVQQTMHNLAWGFLRDPFFGSVLRGFIYDNFVVGKLNGIPLAGSLLALHVASFLCRQHHSFMYSIGE